MDEEQDRDLKPSVQRVATALRALGVAPQIVEFTESTRTAEDAARALGTSVERIVKPLVFTAGGAPLLVLVSGVNRVAVDRLREALGVEVRRADASVVREATGFAIGGVPPIGHATQLPVILDRDLMQYELVYAAAGTPNSVFPITPQDLHRITGARVLDVKEQAG